MTLVCDIRRVSVEEYGGVDYCDFCGREDAKYLIEVTEHCREYDIKEWRLVREYEDTYDFFKICEKCLAKLAEALAKKKIVEF